MTRVRFAFALLFLAASAGCGAAVEPEPDRDPSRSHEAGPSGPYAPLTGEPTRGRSMEHPAVAIKISDVEQAHPQVGIDRADIVFCEPIGPSYTRLAAVFHSDIPDLAGPVRSVRPADAALLGPLRAVFGNTSAADWVLDYVEQAANLDDLGTLTVGFDKAYTEDPDRPDPDDIFARPQRLLDLSDFRDPPEPYFDYATAGDQTSASVANGKGRSVTIPYGQGFNVAWEYDAKQKRYLRSEPWGKHVTQDGTRIEAANVVVIQVNAPTRKIGTAPGAPVPVQELVDGSGRFTALTGGHSVNGTWSKGQANSAFEFRTDNGDPLRLTPGNTWVELPAATADLGLR